MVFRHAALHLREKHEKVFTSVRREALLVGRRRRDIQLGKPRRRAMAIVVVRHSAGAAFFHRQARLRAIRRLKLAFLIKQKDDGPLGRTQRQPHDITRLRDELRIGRQCELLQRAAGVAGREGLDDLCALDEALRRGLRPDQRFLPRAVATLQGDYPDRQWRDVHDDTHSV